MISSPLQKQISYHKLIMRILIKLIETFQKVSFSITKIK